MGSSGQCAAILVPLPLMAMHPPESHPHRQLFCARREEQLQASNKRAMLNSQRGNTRARDPFSRYLIC